MALIPLYLALITCTKSALKFSAWVENLSSHFVSILQIFTKITIHYNFFLLDILTSAYKKNCCIISFLLFLKEPKTYKLKILQGKTN